MFNTYISSIVCFIKWKQKSWLLFCSVVLLFLHSVLVSDIAPPVIWNARVIWPNIHYNDVIMTTITSRNTCLTVVYSTVYSDADQRKHQSSAWLAFVWGIHRDWWIPRTKGQLRWKCFHLMTSSCRADGWIWNSYFAVLQVGNKFKCTPIDIYSQTFTYSMSFQRNYIV